MDAILSLYNDIRDAVGSRVPEIAHVGMWNQNVAYAVDDAAYGLPALFVEFGEIAWNNLCKHGGGLIALGEGTLSIHLLTEWHDDSDYELPFRLAREVGFAIDAIDANTQYGIHAPVSTVVSHDHSDLMETVDTYKARFFRTFRIPKGGV